MIARTSASATLPIVSANCFVLHLHTRQPRYILEMRCQVFEVTAAVLTTPVSHSVGLDVSDTPVRLSHGVTLSRQRR